LRAVIVKKKKRAKSSHKSSTFNTSYSYAKLLANHSSGCLRFTLKSYSSKKKNNKTMQFVTPLNICIVFAVIFLATKL